jgi:hypothetical protein
MSPSNKLIPISFLILFFFSFFIPEPAFCDEKPIAHLTGFSGTVLIQSHGDWAIKPLKNLPLYSMDKVVTRVGTALITFYNGAVVEIKNNSNLLILEETKEEGLIKKIKVVQRRILLFIGNMFFKSGKGHVQTQFETEKTVIGIRGTAGILSVGPDGQIYIQFSEGSAKFTLGDVIQGKIAEKVPTELIDQNPIQKAAYMAFAAAEKCREDRGKAAMGKISSFQMEWSCAYARKLAAKESITWAEAVKNNNPNEETVKWAEQILGEKNSDYEAAEIDEKTFLEKGATPEPIEYHPPVTEEQAEGYTEPETKALIPTKTNDENSDPLINDSESPSPTGGS